MSLVKPKITEELIDKKNCDLHKDKNAARKKLLERKKKISRAEKVRSVQEEKSCPCQGIPF